MFAAVIWEKKNARERKREKKRQPVEHTHICSLGVLHHRTKWKKTRQIAVKSSLAWITSEELFLNVNNESRETILAVQWIFVLFSRLTFTSNNEGCLYMSRSRRGRKRKEKEMTVKHAVLNETSCDWRRTPFFVESVNWEDLKWENEDRW